jgi:YegS/Rv2252/BmrU family lipid kinase
MRKVVLLYNPLSGRRERQRSTRVQAAAAVLRAAGITVEVAATQAAGAAARQVAEAERAGCDTVFACGGDGTIHDVLQGVVGTPLALGIIPMGTANALAHDLSIPLSAEKAARAALTAKPTRIAVGKVEYQDFQQQRAARYFTVTVGIGADAHLFYTLNPGLKNHLGVSAYYLKAFSLWLTRRMEKFVAEIPNVRRSSTVTQVLAVRITNFGGVLKHLAPEAALRRNDLRLVLFHTGKRLEYLRYIIRGMLGTKWEGDSIELMNAGQLKCRYLDEAVSRIYVEADGELLGTLPVELSIIADALTLLVPGG